MWYGYIARYVIVLLENIKFTCKIDPGMVILTFSALTIPTTRRILELKVQGIYMKQLSMKRKEEHANLLEFDG